MPPHFPLALVFMSLHQPPRTLEAQTGWQCSILSLHLPHILEHLWPTIKTVSFLTYSSPLFVEILWISINAHQYMNCSICKLCNKHTRTNSFEDINVSPLLNYFSSFATNPTTYTYYNLQLTPTFFMDTRLVLAQGLSMQGTGWPFTHSNPISSLTFEVVDYCNSTSFTTTTGPSTNIY